MNKPNEFERFLQEHDTPAKDRADGLSRVRDIWESYQGEDDVISFEEIERELENEPEAHKVMTGDEGLDKLTEGFRYQQLVVISAQEKSGKTAFAIELLSKMKDENPCYFLFEQSAKEIVRQRKERGQFLPVGFSPRKNVANGWKWIEDRMMEAMVKYDSRVFVIDNVDWLEKEYGYNQRTDEVIKEMLLKMKEFCKKWEVIIFLIAHVKKVPMDVIPQPDDIKDTSAFKQIADMVLILWRKTKTENVEGTKSKAPYRTNETLLWVAENRHSGKTGYVQYVFDGKQHLQKVWDVNIDVAQKFTEYAEHF